MIGQRHALSDYSAAWVAVAGLYKIVAPDGPLRIMLDPDGKAWRYAVTVAVTWAGQGMRDIADWLRQPLIYTPKDLEVPTPAIHHSTGKL